MIRHTLEVVEYVPLFIFSFPLLSARQFYEAEKFNLHFSNSFEITEIKDKLRYYRYRKALLQREVAAVIGIDRTTYSAYEESGRDYYEVEHMEKLAKLYNVSITELLDDFNLFLYNDQGKQVREKRLKLGMTQREYAKHLGVKLFKLKRWEQNRVRMYKSTWERYFR